MEMKDSFASGIRKLFFVAIGLLSAATSFLYFVEVFSLGRGLVPETWMAVIINGTMGILVLDGAAFAWLRIYLGASDNNDLRALSVVGFGLGVLGSAITSFAYLFSVTEGMSLPAETAVYTQITLAVVIVLHFLLVFASSYRATSAKIDEKVAGLVSRGTEQVMKATEARFYDELEGMVDENVVVVMDQIRARFQMTRSRRPPPQAGTIASPAAEYRVEYRDSDGRWKVSGYEGEFADMVGLATEKEAEWNGKRPYRVALKTTGEVVWPDGQMVPLRPTPPVSNGTS